MKLEIEKRVDPADLDPEALAAWRGKLITPTGETIELNASTIGEFVDVLISLIHEEFIPHMIPVSSKQVDGDEFFKTSGKTKVNLNEGEASL